MKRHLSNDHMLLTNSLKVEIDDKNGSIHKGTDSQHQIYASFRRPSMEGCIMRNMMTQTDLVTGLDTLKQYKLNQIYQSIDARRYAKGEELKV